MSGAPLRIGLLCSLSGPLAPVERSLHEAALIAVDEVNAAGGIGGRRLEAVTADYGSDTTRAMFEAQRLLCEEGVRLLAGGYTSASRVAIQPMLHTHDGLLFYPTYFEGLESDRRTVYVGAVPNQFLVPYVEWILKNLGDRVVQVGSDYIYPRTAGTIVDRIVTDAGGRMLADHYVPLGQTDFAAIIDEISWQRPSVVICNLVGNDSVPAFYRQYHSAGLGPDDAPIAATVTTELDLRTMGPEAAVGHYMTGTYFSSIETPANADFLRALGARTQSEPISHAAQVGMYNAIRLLASAGERVVDLQSTDAWLAALPGTSFAGSPEGQEVVVGADLHTTHPMHIGRADAHGRFAIVRSWGSSEPDPYPALIVGGRDGFEDPAVVVR